MTRASDPDRLELVIHVHGPERGDYPYRAVFADTQHNDTGTTPEGAVASLKARLQPLGYTPELLERCTIKMPQKKR